MNECLEAYKKLKNKMIYQVALKGKTEVQEEWSIIEKELKRLEEIDNVMFLNNKKLKALEIIKEKQLNVGNIIHDIEEHGLTYQEYLDCYDYYQYGGTQLTQEEFDLLKEVLL